MVDRGREDGRGVGVEAAVGRSSRAWRSGPAGGSRWPSPASGIDRAAVQDQPDRDVAVVLAPTPARRRPPRGRSRAAGPVRWLVIVPRARMKYMPILISDFGAAPQMTWAIFLAKSHGSWFAGIAAAALLQVGDVEPGVHRGRRGDGGAGGRAAGLEVPVGFAVEGGGRGWGREGVATRAASRPAADSATATRCLKLALICLLDPVVTPLVHTPGSPPGSARRSILGLYDGRRRNRGERMVVSPADRRNDSHRPAPGVAAASGRSSWSRWWLGGLGSVVSVTPAQAEATGGERARRTPGARRRTRLGDAGLRRRGRSECGQGAGHGRRRHQRHHGLADRRGHQRDDPAAGRAGAGDVHGPLPHQPARRAARGRGLPVRVRGGRLRRPPDRAWTAARRSRR